MNATVIIVIIACCLITLSGGIGIWYYMKKKDESVTPAATPAPPLSVVVNPSLFLYYDLMNSTSYPGTGKQLFDLSGRGNNMLLPDRLSISETSVSGATDGLTSTATSDVDIQVGGDKKITIEGWFKFRQPLPTSEPATSSIGFSTDVQWHGLQIRNRAGVIKGQLVGTGQTSNTWTNECIASNYNNEWMHVVWTLDDSKQRLYVNGVKHSEGNKVALTAKAARIVIRNMHNALRMRVLRVYSNYCLTEAEIKQNYDAEAAKVRMVA